MKKNILIVNDLVFGGGVEKLMYDITHYLYKQHNITILVDNYTPDFYDIYPEDVRYIYKNVRNFPRRTIVERIKYKFYERKFYKKYNEFFEKNKFDLVIALKDGWMVKNVSEMDISKKYAWIHSDYKGYYYTESIFGSKEKELECLKKFEKVICVSQQICDSIKDVIGDSGNLVVKYNPIPVENIKLKAKEVVVDVNLKKEAVRFVTVGRLNHQKGYNLLLEACHMLENEGFKFEVWIIGDREPWGDEADRLYATQKRLEIKSVKFLGGRKNVWKYMKYADWFISSSIFEGYSLVSQEAAVLDIPLLLTECSGVKELIGNNEFGKIMEPSVIGIYRGMKEVLENPKLHTYYKEKIVKRKNIINFDERMKEIEELLGL